MKAHHRVVNDLYHVISKSEDNLPKILQELFHAKIEELKLISAKHTNTVYLIVSDQKKFILKLSLLDFQMPGIKLAYETWCNFNIPCLNVIKAGFEEGFSYILFDYIDDIRGSEIPIKTQESSILAENMGKLLAKMRKIKLEGFGIIDNLNRGKSNSWIDVISNTTIPQINKLQDCNLLSLNEVEVLDEVLHYINENAKDFCLLHGDYYFHNIFSDIKGNIKFIFDPNPMVGDPLWDIVIFDFFNQRTSYLHDHAFVKEYVNGQIHNDYNMKFEMFISGYEQELGRKLTREELKLILAYKIVVLIQKMEKYLFVNKFDYFDFTRFYLEKCINEWKLSRSN